MIGILSDSHDNLTRVREAVRLFNDAGCSLVIHPGDFVAPFNRHLASKAYDVVVFGHTHLPLAERRDGGLLVNPGEAGGWLRGKSTIALLAPGRPAPHT